MSTWEAVGLIVAFPLLVVIGMFLVPIVIGALAIILGAIIFVGGLIISALSYPVCAYNKWRDKKIAEKEYEDLLQWRKDNPEIYASCRREYLNSVEGKE